MGIDTILSPARSYEERIKGSEANVIQRCSAAVLQSEREKTFEVGGKMSNVKVQNPNG
jgi:hypothetical protein